MTVKLLMDWPDSRDGKNYLAGNLLTTDAGTESGLVAAKMATSTLTGGTAYVPPVEQIQTSPVMAYKTLTGEIELIGPDGQPISVGGGGINPDATGTLAGRSAHDAEAVGFVYLATDQVPAEYYFREGASGNWSAAVEVQGPTGATGATGPQGPQGIQGATGPQGATGAQGTQGIQGATGATGPAGADGVTFVSGTTAPNNADGRPDGTVYVRYTA
ncbi:MAG: hypothetical protein WBK19_10515 [Azonexus sp.]